LKPNIFGFLTKESKLYEVALNILFEIHCGA